MEENVVLRVKAGNDSYTKTKIYSRNRESDMVAKRQYGGNLGNTFAFGGPITPGAPIGNTAEVIPSSSCLATARGTEVSVSPAGLPGMGGGGRRKKGKRTRGKKQRGGRYSFDLSATLAPSAGPGLGSIPQVMRIPCESAVSNPLNPVQMGGVGGIDSAFYAAPTAGYSNTPSSWLGSTGSPSMLQTPYEARTTPPVCFKTGGGKRRNTRRRKKSYRKNTHRRR